MKGAQAAGVASDELLRFVGLDLRAVQRRHSLQGWASGRGKGADCKAGIKEQGVHVSPHPHPTFSPPPTHSHTSPTRPHLPGRQYGKVTERLMFARLIHILTCCMAFKNILDMSDAHPAKVWGLVWGLV